MLILYLIMLEKVLVQMDIQLLRDLLLKNFKKYSEVKITKKTKGSKAAKKAANKAIRQFAKLQLKK